MKKTLFFWLLLHLTVSNSLAQSIPASTNPSLREVLVQKLQTQSKVNLELFVMSQCPYGVMAEEAIIPLVKEFGNQIDFRIQYIVQPNQKGGFKSLHGDAELNENLRQLIIAKHFPEKWLDYLLSRAKNYRTDQWQVAAQAVGIDISFVESQMNQSETIEMIASHSNYVASRKVYGSPSVFVDGQRILIPLKNANSNCESAPQIESLQNSKALIKSLNSIPADASINDGPIEIKARVREINVNATANDIAFFGVIGQPDDYSFKLWMNDLYDIDATGWVGGQLLTENFDPPGNTSDFNHTFYQHTFATSASPKLLNIKFEAWEDESPDQLLGIGCGGTRGNFDRGFCCGGFLFGLCLGAIDDDDNHCSAEPFISNINYRLGAPGQWYDHGQQTGVADANNFYKPHIETYWRYTKGTSLPNAIELGTLQRGNNTAPVNTTSTYENSFTANDGNDVIYHFTNSQRALYDFTLCSGTTFDTQLYLLDNAGVVLANNDNFCGTQSAIMGYDLPAGDYYVVVSGKTATDNGLFTLSIISQGVIFVKPTGSDENDGATWDSAFKTLHKALTVATPSNQIWVAAGTYLPQADKTGNMSPTYSSSKTFVMKEGVKIYGGFAGTESNLADRNWKTNVTILSGDHNGDDVVNVGSTFSLTNYGENSANVIFNDRNGLTSAAVLDGFTITAGSASEAVGGSGIYNRSVSPTIENCTFINNTCGGMGAGMYNWSSSNPIVKNCNFVQNFGSVGVGMGNDGSSPTLINCSFFGNWAKAGGALANSSNSNPSLINCAFWGNFSLDKTFSGGILNYGNAAPTLINCTFSGNDGAAMYNETGTAVPVLKNCIFWGNRIEVTDPSNRVIYFNTLVKGRVVGGFQGTENPLFMNQPDFNTTPTIVGDLRLQSCSPLLNQGNNSFVPNGITTDLANNPRLFNIVDLGAYEYQGNKVVLPTALASANPSKVCQGTTINLSANGGNSFSWVGPAGSSFTSTQSTPSFIASSMVFGGIYSVTVSNSNCLIASPSTTVSVSVQAATLSISPNPLNVCIGQTINLSTNASPAASAFSWKGPGNFSSTTQNISTYATTTANLGIYSVSATIGSCTVSTFAEVKSGAILKAGVVGIPCVGGTIQFTATGMSSYTWSRTTNNFNSNLPNPVIPSSSLNDAGIYFLSARSGSCVASALVPVMLTGSGINPSFSVSPSTIAAGATVALSAASASGVYSWGGPSGFSGNTRTKTITNFQAANNGTYRLTLTVGTCTGYTEKNISINAATRLAAAENEPMEMEINAYPNPVTHTLTVEVRLKEPSALQLNLLNSVGKPSGTWQLNEVSTFHKTELNLADLQGGVYLLQAQAGKQKTLKRIVKVMY
ncbi:MAG: T9SS type A sorting domain-containing protein [Spirosomataceae bacterium]